MWLVFSTGVVLLNMFAVPQAMRAEPKQLFGNERVFLTWLR